MSAVLIVDDDAAFSELLERDASRRWGTATTASSIAGAKEAISLQPFDVALVDLRLPDGDGLSLLEPILRANAQAKVFLLTADDSVPSVVRALKSGAHDYFTKPIDRQKLLHAVDHALQACLLERESELTRRKLALESSPEPALPADLDDLISRAARSDAPAIITGETGTGKTMIARLIHARGGEQRPFVTLNCTAVPESLLEAELFGHERGAFTGASQARPGLVELADGGTLFLDEIGDLSPTLQPKLLTLLEERSLRRLGGTLNRPVKVRFIAATNRPLEAEVRAGRFREDLYFRINILRIEVPPLRARRDQIQLLAARFAAAVSGQLSPGELARLAEYHWPGNVRELRNIIERAHWLTEGPDLRPSRLLTPVAAPARTPALPAPENATLEQLIDQHVLAAFERHGRHQQKTAAALGISLSTLRRRLTSLGELGKRQIDTPE
ncbi:MAG TPA: sigma-54 dependent transcriptional regulator [Myxococcales bacterium]|nr:sigma-54 dependent transcriptional regulator [Myxococcales bacterium]